MIMDTNNTILGVYVAICKSWLVNPWNQNDSEYAMRPIVDGNNFLDFKTHFVA